MTCPKRMRPAFRRVPRESSRLSMSARGQRGESPGITTILHLVSSRDSEITQFRSGKSSMPCTPRLRISRGLAQSQNGRNGIRKNFTLWMEAFSSSSSRKAPLPVPTSSALPCMDLLLGKIIKPDSPVFSSKLWHGHQLTSSRLQAMLGDYKCPPRGCLGNLHL